MSTPRLPEVQRAVQLVAPDELILNAEKSVPAPGPYQILCEVVVVGLCFSDLKLLKQFSSHVRKSDVVSGIDPAVLEQFPGYVPGEAPTVPGHEPVVRVVKVGSAVRHFKPGERYFIQADWRWLKTAGSNGAFGYNFEGALQEYVLLDERIVTSPEGESMLLPAPEGDRSAAAFGLVEPWACAENSYRVRERRTLKAGGRLLVVADSTPDIEKLRRVFESGPRPARMTWVSPRLSIPAHWPVPAERANTLSEAQSGPYDDVLYFGHDPDMVEKIFAKTANNGLILLVLGSSKFGRPVQTALGAVHYRGVRIAGTRTHDPMDALKSIPESGELRPNDTCHVVGAGGPMGVMHVVRNICQGVVGLTVVAADLSNARLVALDRLARPKAKHYGVKYESYNSTSGTRPGPFDYAVIMAPVPALVAAAVEASSPRGIINIFAGIPVDKSGPVDLDIYTERQLYFIGTSGSDMSDMRVVLSKVESGALDTNVSVAAISGLDGAVEGIRAVEAQSVAGKIMVYPACRGLPLTRLEELSHSLPSVADGLADGVWTKAAEDALIEHFKDSKDA